MIVIYDQDGTWIHNNADEAKDTLLEVYGEKFGQEAYKYLQHAPMGSSFRRNGGPLVQVVDKEKAAWIRGKEAAIGMLQ